MEGSMSKKMKEPPKSVNHKWNVKFLNPLRLQEAYQIRRQDLLKGLGFRQDLQKGGLAQKNPHLLQLHDSKWRPPVHTVTPLTPSVYKKCAKLTVEPTDVTPNEKMETINFKMWNQEDVRVDWQVTEHFRADRIQGEGSVVSGVQTKLELLLLLHLTH